MADSAAENAAFSGKVVFGVAAAFYLPLLTWKIIMNFLLIGLRFPTGWPETVFAQLWAWMFIAFLGLLLVSAGVLCVVSGGFLLRGREWLSARSKWLFVLAGAAPVSLVWTAIGSLRRVMHAFSRDYSGLGEHTHQISGEIAERMMALAVGNMILAAIGIVLFICLFWMSRRGGA